MKTLYKKTVNFYKKLLTHAHEICDYLFIEEGHTKEGLIMSTIITFADFCAVIKQQFFKNQEFFFTFSVKKSSCLFSVDKKSAGKFSGTDFMLCEGDKEGYINLYVYQADTVSLFEGQENIKISVKNARKMAKNCIEAVKSS